MIMKSFLRSGKDLDVEQLSEEKMCQLEVLSHPCSTSHTVEVDADKLRESEMITFARN